MKTSLQPWQLLLLVLAGWASRQQQDAIAYLRTENRVLRDILGKKRILLNDNQRRRLAIKGKILGRRMLEEEYAAELGVDHYLGKPYSEEELLGLIGRYCAAAQVAPA